MLRRSRIALLALGVLALSSQGPRAAADDSLKEPTAASESLGWLARAEPGIDRVEAATSRSLGWTVLGINRGRAGGADLLLSSGGKLLSRKRVSESQTVSAPVWSPRGDRYAYVVQQASLRVPSAQGPILHFQGSLFWEYPLATAQQVAGLSDAARVLGWADDSTVVITRYRPGDLPEERPFLVSLKHGTVQALLEDTPHVYGLQWVQGRLVYARSSAPVVTAPGPDQYVEVVSLGLTGDSLVLASEQGHMPSGFRAQGSDYLAYDLEDSLETRIVHLPSRQSVSVVRDLPEVSIPAAQPFDLSMPYIHQVYDTPDEFDGHWACGPTSTVMAITHFGRLDKWPITVSIPDPHNSDYGAYVSRKYTAYGTTFDTMQTDASGKAAYGAYGWCTIDGAAWAYRMQDYAEKHGLETEFEDSPSLAKVKSAIDAGKVVVLSTQLTSAGHIIAIKGYTADDKMVVNDPYGDKNQGYMNYKGEGALYTWAQVSSKWFITVYTTGPQFKASILDKKGPSTMVSGETATASVTYKNEGWATWDDNTLLGTTKDRDRNSPFQDPSWPKANRAAKVPSETKSGAEVTVSFKLTAPMVCTPTPYTEHFNLVQESVAWFSDSAQGGPADDALAFAITVNPPTGGCTEAGAPDSGSPEAGKDSAVSADAGKDGAAPSQEASADSSKADAKAPTSDGGGLAKISPTSDEGCSCRAAGQERSQLGGLVGLGLGLGLLYRRRRPLARRR